MKAPEQTKKEKQPARIEVADFETTVYEGQQYTEVWAAATVEIGTEDVQVFHSIGDLIDYYVMMERSLIVYFHNLKFDGQFLLYYFLKVLKFKQATEWDHSDLENRDIKFLRAYKMPQKSIKYMISDMGAWYSITVKINHHTIEFRDSLKLLPFSVREIGRAFKTKHQKLDMEYKGFRYAGCPISDMEMEYIKNDVLVVKEALELMFQEGHTKLTIGSCCMEEFKKSLLLGYQEYDTLFPDLYTIGIDEETYGSKTAGDYILRSYRGGWCYVVKEKAGRIYTKGLTADVNSLYPSMMSSESGNAYPVGRPTFWSGDYIPETAQDGNHYFFVRIRTRFYLKPGYLPFVQIKRCTLYKGTECLVTSSVYSEKQKKWCRWIRINGKLIDTKQTLTMTMTDYKLFLEHYDTEEFEILDGCYFYSEKGIFDKYIDKYKKIKLESKGAKRTQAKLFLNNLYGRMAMNTDSSFKYAYLRETGEVGFMPIEEHEKRPGYIACGSAITSYARNFTIRAAQANYHGPENPGFIYADTDSIHCDLDPEDLVNVPIHDRDFCHWKLESYWDRAIFSRQKTYMEHVTHEDGEAIEKPYNNIKCAGMPERCKELLNLRIEGGAKLYGHLENGVWKQWGKEQFDFLFTRGGKERRMEYEDFTTGLKVPGKLFPVTIPGGVILCEGDYEMREPGRKVF